MVVAATGPPRATDAPAPLAGGAIVPERVRGGAVTVSETDAVRTVLADPAYRRNAERLRDEIRALPGPEYAVTLLERLAAERRPLAAAA